MNSRNEMIPAPIRAARQTMYLCGPEWKLLCRIRERMMRTKSLTRARDVRVQLRAIIADMNETFTDWPEDPK
ncbi:unnamed protein product [marine sediment metagenome]|uniref:Uncharacterized protein n=1 Tax=marine sediment metagenome TaxID=412755 RepID=X1LC13_9ZZZZ